MGILWFLLILVALPIMIVLLIVNIIGAVFWFVRGIFSVLLFLLKPFKLLLYAVLAAAGFVWLTSD